jgi:hypothetical protein
MTEEDLDSTAVVVVLCVCVILGMMFTTTNRLLANTTSTTDACANAAGVCREAKTDMKPTRFEVWLNEHRESIR